MPTTRNSYMISRAMNKFLLPALLTLIIQQICVTIDSIFVSYYVSSTAMAAITLYMPINMLIFTLGTLLGNSGVLVAVQAFGRQDKQGADDALSTSLFSQLIVGAVLGLASWLGMDYVSALVCGSADAALAPHFRSYAMPLMAFMSVQLTEVFLGSMVPVLGAPQVATRAAVAVFATDILMDWVFIGLLGMGVAGSAWATFLSYVVGMLVLIIYLLRHRGLVSLRWRKGMFARYLPANLKVGSSMLLANMLLTVLLFINNSFVQHSLGAPGMVMLAVCMNVQSLVLLVASGYRNTLFGVGGYMYGEGDYHGLNLLFRRCMIHLYSFLGLALLLIEVAPGIISALFSVDPEAVAGVNRALRLYAPYIPLFATLIVLGSFYLVMGQQRFMIASIVPLTILQWPMFQLVTWAFGADWLWITFPLAGMLTVLCWLGIVERAIIRSDIPRHHISFIPMESPEELLLLSVAATREGVAQALPQLQQCLGDVPTERAHAVEHALEELMLNIAAHGGRMQGHYFDLRLARTATGLRATIKDDGLPFDPSTLADADRGVGLTLAFAYVKTLTHKYMYGQNVTNIEFE